MRSHDCLIGHEANKSEQLESSFENEGVYGETNARFGIYDVDLTGNDLFPLFLAVI